MPYKDPEKGRAHQREYYKKNRDKELSKRLSPNGRAIQKKYNNSPKGKATRKRYDNQYAKKNPKKRKAKDYARQHNLRGTECEVCPSTENLDGHHPDYSQPGWIITMCRKHHNDVKIIQRNLLEAIQQANILKNIIGGDYYGKTESI